MPLDPAFLYLRVFCYHFNIRNYNDRNTRVEISERADPPGRPDLLPGARPLLLKLGEPHSRYPGHFRSRLRPLLGNGPVPHPRGQVRRHPVGGLPHLEAGKPRDGAGERHGLRPLAAGHRFLAPHRPAGALPLLLRRLLELVRHITQHARYWHRTALRTNHHGLIPWGMEPGGLLRRVDRLPDDRRRGRSNVAFHAQRNPARRRLC